VTTETETETDTGIVPLFWPGPSLRPDYPHFVANINDEVTLWADTTLRDFRVYPINSIGWEISFNHQGPYIVGAYSPTIEIVTEHTRVGYDAVYRNRETILLYVAMLTK
jgi:hypothetical protein